MNYRRILFFSVPLGILLSSGALSPESTNGDGTASARPLVAAKSKVYSEPLPGYVKPNQGTAAVDPSGVQPCIFVQVIWPNKDSPGHIRYIITDKNGVPGEWHDDTTANESSNSSIFKPSFDFNTDITVGPGPTNPTTNKPEVKITGTSGGKSCTWISDCSKSAGSFADDSDVSWDH